MMLREVVQVAKRAMVPGGSRYRRIPIGPAAGCVMNLDLHHQMRLFLGIYEAELRPYFSELIHRGAKCFDIGGRDGYDALVLAKLSGGRVVSVECDREPATSMRETFARNSYPIEVVEKFVCDREDATHTTLDRLATEIFIPTFIKMDIEGAEADALRGARGLLGGTRPPFIIEVHGEEVESECVEILAEYRYKIQVVPQRRWFKEVRPLAHNQWLVCRP